MRTIDDINTMNIINLTLHCCLLIALLCILSATLMDGYWRTKRSYQNYVYSILLSVFQCCLVAIFLSTKLMNVDYIFVKLFYVIAAFLIPITYVPRIMNVVALIEEKKQVEKWIKDFVMIVPLVVSFLTSIYVILYTGDLTNLFYDFNQDIALEAVYLFTFIFAFFGFYVVIRYHKFLDKKITLNLSIFLLLPAVASLVMQWQFAITNLVSTYTFFIMYVGMWQSKKYEIIENEKHIAQVEAQLSESRNETMISQIQPHFIYNTLSSIAALCEINPQKAQEVTINFSDYLRNNLKSISEKTPVSFEKELKHTMLYVGIEKVRFQDSLNVEYDIKTKNFTLPSLTLQPIVENAIKHGVTKKEGGGIVKIATYEDSNNYYVKVSDDGVGFDMDKVKDDGQVHLGVNSTTTRLKNMINGDMTIVSELGVGTVVTISIPKNKEEK